MERQTPRIRQMDLGAILDGGIALYRRNFVLLLGVAAIISVPLTIINVIVNRAVAGQPLSVTQTAGTGNQPGVHFHPGFVVALVATWLLTVLFGIVTTGALAKAISERYLGQGLTILGAYASVGVTRFVRLLLASILTGVLIALAFVVSCIPLGLLLLIDFLSGSGGTGLFVLMVVVGVLTVPLAFFAGVGTLVRLLFVPQSIVVEDKRVIDSLRRSWDLVGGTFWRVAGIWLIISVMVAFLSGIVGGVITGVLLVSAPLLGSIAGGLVGILLQPFQYGALTLLYFDLRIRKEGFDIEHSMEQPDPSGSWQPAGWNAP